MLIKIASFNVITYLNTLHFSKLEIASAVKIQAHISGKVKDTKQIWSADKRRYSSVLIRILLTVKFKVRRLEFSLKSRISGTV